VLPILGVDLLSSVLGDSVVDYYTLMRIEVVHLPLLVVLIVVVHLLLIHRNVSASVCSIVGVHAYSDGDSMLCVVVKDSMYAVALSFLCWDICQNNCMCVWLTTM